MEQSIYADQGKEALERVILMLMIFLVMIMSMISILMLMMRVRREALERSQVLLPVSVGYGGGAGRVAKENK